MCETVFLLYLFEGGDLKVQLSWNLKGVNIGMTLTDRYQEGVKCQLSFFVERPGEEGAPLGCGDVGIWLF